MDEVSIYIKKLIGLALSAFVMYLLTRFIDLYFALPFGFLVLSYLQFQITGEKPSWISGMMQAEQYFREKSGFWLLLRWILMFFGFIYDLVAWTIYGVFILFTLFIDLLILLRTIIFWIVHAVLWFFRLLVYPVVFLYRMIIHYLIFWPWWIYRLTFRNIRISVNSNFYRIAFRGTFPAILIVLVFYGSGVLLGAPVIGIFGGIFAFLPLIWSLTEIAALRHENRWNTPFSTIKFRFGSGNLAMKAVLFYLVIMFTGILTEILLDMLGWFPLAGFSLLGLSLNINTFISLILVFLFVVLLFATFLIPPHIVSERAYTNTAGSIVQFLGVIGRRFLRYLVSLIPASLFSIILAIIPVIVVSLAVYLTISLKDFVLESRITRMNHTAATLEGRSEAGMRMKIDRLEYYRDFPQNVFTGFVNIKTLNKKRKVMESDYSRGHSEMERLERMYQHELDSLQAVADRYKNPEDSVQSAIYRRLTNSIEQRKSDINAWETKRSQDLQVLQMRISDLKSRISQLPFAFLLVIIWFAFFGGLVFSVIVSYLGNIFHELYDLKEDGKPTYWHQIAAEMKKKDHNQPLLGFTIMFLIVIILTIIVGTGILA